MGKEIPKRLLVILLAAAVLIYGLYTYVFSPRLKSIAQSKQNLKIIESEISGLMPNQRILKNGKMSDLINEEIGKLSAKIPGEKEIIPIIEKIISIPGLDYLNLEPKGILNEDRYRRLPLSLKFKSSFYSFDQFLQQLEDLPLISRLDEFTLYREENTGQIEVAAQISVFLFPEPETPAPPPDSKYHQKITDPFHKAVPAPALENTVQKPETPFLNGIWQGKNLKAFINNQAVSKGQAVDGYQVLAISKDKVTLLKNGKKYTLKEEVK